MSRVCGLDAIRMYNVMFLSWLRNVYTTILLKKCIYDNNADAILQNTPNYCSSCAGNPYVFVHNNTGLVNGWCVSINRMIKVFPGPPLHVCYVFYV